MTTSFFESTAQAILLSNQAISDSPAASKAIVIEAFSETQWRVRDTRWPQRDARTLRGYIESRDGVFEVMQLDHGFQWFSYATLEEASAHFTTASLDESGDNDNVLQRLREHV